MKVKLLARFAKDQNSKESKEIDAELDIQRIIKQDAFNEEEERAKLMASESAFDYAETVLDMKDVCIFNSFGEDHTTARLYNGVAWTFKIPFLMFEAVYSSTLGVAIHDYTNPRILKPQIRNEI